MIIVLTILKVVGWILLILLLLLFLLFCMPVHLHLRYSQEGFFGEGRYLFLKKGLTEKKEEKDDEPSKQENPSPEKDEKKKKAPLLFRLTSYLQLGRRQAASLGRAARFLLHHIHLKDTVFRMRVHSDDPGDTAVLFGRWSGVIYGLYALLDQLFSLRPPVIQVAPDFLDQGFFLFFETKVWLRPICLLGLLPALWRFYWDWKKTERELSAYAAPSI